MVISSMVRYCPSSESTHADFVVDYGYILGRDPKPYPPPVKVCKEMVDAMGGTTSTHYARFQSLSYTAFIGLRKNVNLILNLVALMVDAGIQDIQLEPDKAVWKVCLSCLNRDRKLMNLRCRRSSCLMSVKKWLSSSLRLY